MKRSRAIQLVLVGVTPLMLAGCDQPKPGYLYRSVAECIRDGTFTPSLCSSEYESSRAVHHRSAPRYASLGECEIDFGTNGCELLEPRSSFYVPLMTGFLLGQRTPRESESSSSGGASYGYSSSVSGGQRQREYTRTFPSQPLYQSRDDLAHYRTANNEVVGSRPGIAYLNKSAYASSESRVVSRGGFGARAASYSSRSSGS